MEFFSLNSSQWELSVVCQRIFSISYRFRDIRGQRGPKCNLWGSIRYSFFVQFWWDIFHWIPLNESFQNCYSPFFLSLTVFEIQGAQKGKNAIFEAKSELYFSFNFDGIFFIGFLWMRSFRSVTADFFHLLLFSRYKGAKMWFLGLHKIFIFHPILMGFLVRLNEVEGELL